MKQSVIFKLFVLVNICFISLLLQFNFVNSSHLQASSQAISGPAGEIFLPLISIPHVYSPAVLKPFDVNQSDLGGPTSWNANYGKSPELIVASNGLELDVWAQDYDETTSWSAVLLHIEPTLDGYVVTQILTDVPMLDRVMGLALDASGNRYYATGVDESDLISPEYPPLDTYRSNIVRVVKVSPTGEVLFNVDLDLARHNFNNQAEMIINPMVASTARLAVGNNQVAIVHGINTDPDWNINGTRHQKALSTRLNATTGEVTRVSGSWVSHSFDQRLMYDGEGIIEYHLGDAYPRYVVFSRDFESYPLFHIKGPLGENLTATRLGNVVPIEGDPDYTYLALFATESTTTPGNIFNSKINGPRNLGIVRVKETDNSLDPNLPDMLTVVSAGVEQTNRLNWLTTYTAESNLHAERPKIVKISTTQYIVLWEEWLNVDENTDTFQGVYGMVIDDEGTIIQPATLLTSDTHLPRGDDAFFLDNQAGWMTGNSETRTLFIHLVDASLNYEVIEVH